MLLARRMVGSYVPGARAARCARPRARAAALFRAQPWPVRSERPLPLAHPALIAVPDRQCDRDHAGRRRYPQEPARGLNNQPTPPDRLVESAVRIRLVGANPHPRFTVLDPLPGRVNYLIGNDPAKVHRNVPTFGRVKKSEVYPGVDVTYYGQPKRSSTTSSRRRAPTFRRSGSRSRDRPRPRLTVTATS